MNTENSKTNEPHKLVLNLSQRLDLAPAWNDEYELPDGSSLVSDIQVFNEYIIKKHETLTAISPTYVCIIRINKRLMFKIKDGYKLELHMLETMKLLVSTKKLIDKKKEEKVPSLKVAEVVSVRCNLVDHSINKILKYYTHLHPKHLILIT